MRKIRKVCDDGIRKPIGKKKTDKKLMTKRVEKTIERDRELMQMREYQEKKRQERYLTNTKQEQNKDKSSKLEERGR